MNHRDNGMSWSLCMCEQRENEESQKRKSHVTFGTAAATKVVFGMFSLIALVSNITIPKHQTNPNATYTKHVVNWFHEVNDLYNGTLNEVHHFLH